MAVRTELGSAALLWLAWGCAPAEHRDATSAPAAKPPNAALPGPAPRGRTPDDARALNATCEGCHAEIAREWRSSLHAQAHTDAAYQRAFAIEPLPFCQGCHAPEASPYEPVPEAAAALGVACVTCHVLGSDVVGAPREHATESTASRAPHPVVRDGRLAGTAACAGCHEFSFPDRGMRASPALMQSTVSEHARSLASGSSCADCHMPVLQRGAKHRDHRFAGGRDETLVKRAVSVTAARTGPGSVRVSLAPRDVGHAFPTGDLFRRLAVSAEAVGPEWHVVAADRRYLARHWERDPKSPFGVVLKRAVRDDRPLAERIDVELELGERAGAFPIAWRVAYQRVAHPRSEDANESVVEGEIELSSGTFPSAP